MSRRFMLPALVASAVALTATTLALSACGGGGTSAGPTVVSTPATPAATPKASPTPAVALPAGMVCDPTPPPLYGLKLKVHANSGGARRILDSRPVVINVDGYCEKAGFASSAKFCYTRDEGDPQATACDYLVVGRSAETGRFGPTWSYNGKPCTAGAGEDGCSNNPDNQFLVNARGDGQYQACVASEIPLSTDPNLPGSRCGDCTIAGGALCE